jgi:hypothetical protein
MEILVDLTVAMEEYALATKINADPNLGIRRCRAVDHQCRVGSLKYGTSFLGAADSGGA